MNIYDWIIVGGGPTGLSLAWLLAKYNQTVLIIEREETVGGCHRVRRVFQNGIFTEHGPRIYSENYLTTQSLFADMGINFTDEFVPYKFFFNNIAPSLWGQLAWKDIWSFFIVYLKFFWNEDSVTGVTMAQFMQENNFSDKGADFVARLCRLTDGAGPDRYTLWEFLQLINQNFQYQILQPKLPTDIGFLQKWTQALLKTGKVQIATHHEVQRLQSDISIETYNWQTGEQKQYWGKNFVLAIPLPSIAKILRNSEHRFQEAFGPLEEFTQFSQVTDYNTYIPITFHWKDRIELPPQWGYPRGNWEVATIVLSDYMNLDQYQTLISTCISVVNKPSSRTGKTANESTSEEIIQEVWNEVQHLYPMIPKADKALISPGVYYDKSWKTRDHAFILTTHGFFPRHRSLSIPNLYNVGPHNGYSPLAFTTMESGVANAFHLFHELYPDLANEYPIRHPQTLNNRLKTWISIVLVIVILIYLYKNNIFGM